METRNRESEGNAVIPISYQNIMVAVGGKMHARGRNRSGSR